MSESADNGMQTNLLREILRKIERLERANSTMSKELSYIREAVRFKVTSDFKLGDPTSLTKTLALDLASDFDGINWHFAETEGRQSSRWSGPGRLSTLYLPLAREIPLTCRVTISSYVEGVAPGLTMFIDGTRAEAHQSQGLPQILEVVIPPLENAAFLTEIGFLANGVAQPPKNEHGEGDQRWLSFKLAGVEVFPTESEEN